MTLGLPSGEVRLLHEHEAWADAFRYERRRIIEAIGKHALDIQHVGSTAVPGVPAKPVLDVLVGVASFEEAGVCVAPLEAIGYTYRAEHGIPRRHYFVKGNPRTHHLHMVEKHSEHWLVTLRFRNLLETNPAARGTYTDAKLELAALYPHDREAYQREKDKIVERLLQGQRTSAASSPTHAAESR